jgi:hypothetical protein
MPDREQDFVSSTDQEDLESVLHSSDTPVDDDTNQPGEIFVNVPQEYTESYGTGVHDLPGDREGGHTMRRRDRQLHAAEPDLTGGDIDANYEQAYSVGDEAVGGTVATPDKNVVEDLGEAVGLEMDDRQYLQTDDILNRRDEHPWELDPMSSEDYQERRQNEESMQ